MSTWHVSTDVLKVHGTQVWAVDASSAKEALEAFRQGEGQLVAEEIEVMHVGEPYGAEEVPL